MNNLIDPQEPEVTAPNPDIRATLYNLMFLLTAVASVLSLPFVHSLTVMSGSTGLSGPGLWVALIVGILLQNSIMTAVMARLGLFFGSRTGLGAPILTQMVGSSDFDFKPYLKTLLFAFAVGIGVGLLITVLSIGLENWDAISLPQPPAGVSHPSWLPSLMVSISAGINEEIWMRLGLMTFLIALLQKLSKRERPNSVQIWTGNILATLAFGAMHLPQAAALFDLTGFLILVILFLNGLAGLFFGWLYWRWGLLAAMVAHFSTDLVLHVFVPLVQ